MCENSDKFLSVRISPVSTCQNITGVQQKGTPNPPRRPSPLQPQHHLCSPYLAGANDKPMGESTPWSPHTQACTRQLGKKEAGRRGWPAHLTRNRASSWVGLKADSSPETAPSMTPSRKSRKERGRSWSVIVLLDFYQDVLGLGVQHLVKCFKPIILTLYHWRINTQIP